MSYFGPPTCRFTLIDVDGIILANPEDELDILEPEDFARTAFLYERQEEYKAINAEFTDSDSLSLGLDKVKHLNADYSPYEFIDLFTDKVGYGGLIVLRGYRLLDGQTVETYRDWQIDMSTLEKTELSYTCKVKKTFFYDKLRSRFESDINVEAVINLDNVASPPLSLYNLPMFSKGIDYNMWALYKLNPRWTTYFSGYNETKGDIASGGNYMLWGYDDIIESSNEIVLNNFKQYVWQDQAETYEDRDRALFRASKAGIYEIEVFAWTEWTDANNAGNLTAQIVINGGTTTEQKFTIPKTLENSDTPGLYTQYWYKWTKVVTVSLNETDFVHIVWKDTSRDEFIDRYVSYYYPTTGYPEDERSRISINLVAYNPVSETPGAFIFDLLNSLLQKATGFTYDVLQSSLLARVENDSQNDGEAALDFITSGNKLANFDEPLVLSIKKLVDYVVKRYNAGMCFAIVDGEQKLIIEKASYFFNNSSIGTLTNIISLTAKANSALRFNEVEVGYSKYANQLPDTLTIGFNTQKSYVLPVTGIRKSLNIVLDVITDEIQIEQFKIVAAEAKRSTNADTVCVRARRVNRANPLIDIAGSNITVTFDTVEDTILLSGIYIPDTYVSTITIDSGTVNATYTIDAIDHPNFNNSLIKITGSIPTNETNTDYIIYFNVDIFIPERGENYPNLAGVSNIDEVYNLAHTPTNILISWFNYFGGSLVKKPNNSILIFSTRAGNTSLEKTNPLLTGSDIISESQNFTLESLRGYNSELFSDVEYEIVTDMSYDETIAIVNALNGDASLGYVEFAYFDGTIRRAFPVSIRYDLESELTTISAWGQVETLDAGLLVITGYAPEITPNIVQRGQIIITGHSPKIS